MTEPTIAIATVGAWCFIVGFMLGRRPRKEPAPAMVLPFEGPDFNPSIYACGERVIAEAERVILINKCTGLPGTEGRTTLKTPRGEVVLVLAGQINDGDIAFSSQCWDSEQTRTATEMKGYAAALLLRD